MNNKKVYLVWQGEYSDRGVIGVFSTKEEADIYACIHDQIDRWIGGCYVDEWVVDEHKVDKNTKVVEYFYVSVAKHDVQYNPNSRVIKAGELDENEGYSETEIYTGDSSVDIDTYEDWIEAKSCISVEHAEKIAHDAYYRYKAEQEGLN